MSQIVVPVTASSTGASPRSRSPACTGRRESNAQIAAALFMSVATVKSHVSRLRMKLELNNRVQVGLLVLDAGLR